IEDLMRVARSIGKSSAHRFDQTVDDFSRPREASTLPGALHLLLHLLIEELDQRYEEIPHDREAAIGWQIPGLAQSGFPCDPAGGGWQGSFIFSTMERLWCGRIYPSPISSYPTLLGYWIV